MKDERSLFLVKSDLPGFSLASSDQQSFDEYNRRLHYAIQSMHPGITVDFEDEHCQSDLESLQVDFRDQQDLPNPITSSLGNLMPITHSEIENDLDAVSVSNSLNLSQIPSSSDGQPTPDSSNEFKQLDSSSTFDPEETINFLSRNT